MLIRGVRRINPYAVRELAEAGLCAAAIARELDVESRSIRRVAAHHHIPLPNGRPGPVKGYRPTATQRAALDRYRALASKRGAERAGLLTCGKRAQPVTLYRCQDCCQLTTAGPVCPRCKNEEAA